MIIKSYSPILEFRNISSASFPFFASAISRCSSSRIAWAISILMALSSTRSTRFPDRSMLCGQLSFCGSLFSARWSISNGTVNINVLPTFSSLSSSIVPPISSTISLTIESPRPEPLNVVVDRLPSCAKTSNACFWNSSLIPRPVSEHTNWKTAIFPSSDNSSQWTFTVPWKWLYLIALEFSTVST